MRARPRRQPRELFSRSGEPGHLLDLALKCPHRVLRRLEATEGVGWRGTMSSVASLPGLGVPRVRDRTCDQIGLDPAAQRTSVDTRCSRTGRASLRISTAMWATHGPNASADMGVRGPRRAHPLAGHPPCPRRRGEVPKLMMLRFGGVRPDPRLPPDQGVLSDAVDANSGWPAFGTQRSRVQSS
jgi:hypothetical protein